MKLIIPREIEQQILEIVHDTIFETGVTLFGEKEKEEDSFRVLGIAGPGPEATHEELHYCGNNDYSTMVFDDLLKGNPNLKHIGELHVHPFRMKSLSMGDMDTVQELLKEYEEFIAGVILRQKKLLYGGRVKERKIALYPVYFSREKPFGTQMEVQVE